MKTVSKIVLTLAAVLAAMTGTASAKELTGMVRDAGKCYNYALFLPGTTVYPKSDPANRAVTGADGSYAISGVADAEQFLVFEKPGYVKAMKKIDPDSGTLDMALVQEGLTTISDDKFFGEYLDLDYPGLEKVKAAVAEKDMLMAKYELIEYYRNRTSPVWNVASPDPKTDKPKQNFSTIEADREQNHLFTNTGVTASFDVPGKPGEMDWKTVPAKDNEWMWGLNRMFTVLHQGNAWAATFEPRYAYEYMAQYIDWIADNPKPFFKDSNKTWRTIEAGIRNHYPLPNSWYATLRSEEVTTEARITFLKSNLEHMEYLSSYMGGGNWLIFESRGLYTLATLHPEFKQSQKWKDTGFGRAYAQYVGQFKPDGWQYEATPNYHMESTNSISEFEKIAAMNGETTTLREGLKKAFDVEMVYTAPHGKVLPLNDSTNMDLRGVFWNSARLLAGYGTMDGQDYLYMASDGRAGTPPLYLSVFSQYPGYVMMRSGWDANQCSLFFEAGDAGVGSHGKSSMDKLQLIYSAYGRNMLIDSGVYSYAGQPIAKYVYSSPAHNVITIDGENQVRRRNGMNAPAEHALHYEGDGFDFASGVYDELFGELARIDVTHKRSVFFDKSGMVLVNDKLRGEGEHQIDQYWNVAACNWSLGSGGRFIGKYDDGTGLVIVPLNTDGIGCDVAAGREEPLRGWCAPYTGQQQAIPNLRYYYEKGQMPKSIDTLIVPFDNHQEPTIKAEKFVAEPDASGIKFSVGTGDTYYYLLRNEGEGMRSYGAFQFDGDAALITKNAEGKIINIKQYPADSTLYENETLIRGVQVRLPSVQNGDVITSANLSLLAEVTGAEDGAVAYYLQAGQETVLLGETAVGQALECDLSGIADQTGLTLWAEYNDGAGTLRRSRMYTDIELAKEIPAKLRIEMEDRQIAKSGAVVCLADDGASQSMAAAAGQGDGIAAKIVLPSAADISIRMRAQIADTKVKVTMNGVEQELTVQPGYADYPLGRFDGVLDFAAENISDGLVYFDKMSCAGEGIADRNDRVLHHLGDLTDAAILLSTLPGEQYTITADLRSQHFYAPNAEGGFGIVFDNNDVTRYELFYDHKNGKLLVRQQQAAGYTTIAEAPLKLESGKWYHAKLTLSGGNVSAKVWEDTEPEQWQITAALPRVNTGSFGLITSRCDFLADNVRVVIGTEQTPYYNETMEYVVSGSRPSGSNSLRSDTWQAEDKRNLKHCE